MAGVFGFFTKFGEKKVSGLGQSITQALVSWDPETATEAEIEDMIAQLDNITKQAGQAKAIYDKEQKEADVIQANYDKAYAYATKLESDGSTDKLNELLSELEKMKPELDREVQEAVEAKAFYNELTELAKATADKVKTARTTLENAKRDMNRAKIEQQRAADKAAKAEQLAGLRKDTGNLGSALEAMQKSAQEARAQADASNLKASLLKPGESSNIMAEALGHADPPKTLSVSDRLAALKR